MFLKDASPSLRGDNEVVRAACQETAAALTYCAPGCTKWTLGRDKNFLLDVFSRLQHGDRTLWEIVSPTLKLDPDLVVAAYKSECMWTDDLPPECSRDHSFWVQLVRNDSSLWYCLPHDFQNDSDIARSITNFGSQSLVRHVIECFPLLASHRDVWATIIDSELCDEGEDREEEDYRPLRNVIESFATDEILNDKDLMLLACRKDASVLPCLGLDLQMDRDIVQAAVEGNPFVLEFFPFDSQRLFPDLIAQAISNLSEEVEQEGINNWTGSIAEELWTNLAVAEAWFKAGGAFHDRFPDVMKSNRAFGLLIAKYCCDPEDFGYGVSLGLRGDKEFMLAAVEKNGFCYLDAVDRLDRDFDVAVAAFSGPRTDHLEDYFFQCGDREEKKFLSEVLEKVQKKLKSHELYTKGFLYGMSENAGAGCHVRMLIQDAETTLAYKRLIAEFLDVPTGTELGRLRRASNNIPTWDEDCDCSCCRAFVPH
jgi:hypothetical protein